MEVRHLTVARQARYYLSQDFHDGIRYLWFLFHGYGQLAYDFLKSFASCFHPSVLFVAPEGLSRFYLDSRFSRIGASWMTREERLREMEDLHGYLNKLVHLILAQVEAPLFLGFLGFSQGVPVLWRWLSVAGVKPDLVLFWAGIPPLEPPSPLLQQIPIHYIAGTHDPFITPEKLQRVKNTFSTFHLPVQFHTFEGGHTISIPLFEAIWHGVLDGFSQ
jgi:predicted esterase